MRPSCVMGAWMVLRIPVAGARDPARPMLAGGMGLQVNSLPLRPLPLPFHRLCHSRAFCP
ncbi:MAG: hypothetical protein IJA79_07265 [Desulfovibrio sp.]|nr:hypothetical protein [Desulfovibrio sp.]